MKKLAELTFYIQWTNRPCMALALVASILALPLAASAASVTRLEDHSLPRSKVKTYHVTCSNGRFGIVRVDTTVTPSAVCVSVQDGSKIESCGAVGQNVIVPVEMASAAAPFVCQ